MQAIQAAQAIQSAQAIQASTRHTDITELVAEQRAEEESLRARYEEMERHFNKARDGFCTVYPELELQFNKARDAFHNARQVELLQLSKKHEEEKSALREAAWQRAEKSFITKCRHLPLFWTKYPNHDGRRDTMEAVLKSRSMPLVKLDEYMPAYAEWLLTAKKTNKKGPMNRWKLMVAFVTAVWYSV